MKVKFHFSLNDGKVTAPMTSEEIEASIGFFDKTTLVCREGLDTSCPENWRPAISYPELKGLARDGARPASRQGATPAETAASRRVRILSTDDDANIRALLWNILSDEGYDIEFAKDGVEVFRRLEASSYDLLILDVNMPGMNGYKVAEKLTSDSGEHPRILIFTGRDTEAEKFQFVSSGADAILSKYSDPQVILDTVRAVLAPRDEAGDAAPLFPDGKLTFSQFSQFEQQEDGEKGAAPPQTAAEPNKKEDAIKAPPPKPPVAAPVSRPEPVAPRRLPPALRPGAEVVPPPPPVRTETATAGSVALEIREMKVRLDRIERLLHMALTAGLLAILTAIFFVL